MPGSGARIAVLVPPPDYAEEWRWAYDVEAAALERAGAVVTPLPWTEPGDLGGFDLVTPLVAWGYHKSFDAWLALLDRLERERRPVINPVPLLRWNSDKSYLAELTAKGISTVPTIAVDRLDEIALEDARGRFGCADLVVKPPVSASAYGTFRVNERDPFPETVRGWRMMVQPWVEAILDRGEYSLLFFDGVLSHCVSKVPRPGEFRVQPEYGGIIALCDPPAGAERLALRALAEAPAAATYARADIVVGNEGELQIIELELIEPALFLDGSEQGAAAFAKAILSAAERARE